MSKVDPEHIFERSDSIMSKPVLGIDVAKKKLDVALLFDQKSLARKFDNSPNGFKLLQGWLLSLHFE